MQQPGRHWEASADTMYRYGFNGMETDPEAKEGWGPHYTTYFRQYDPRLGRWWSNDPVVQPGESPYVATLNNPILFADPVGNDPNSSGGSDLNQTGTTVEITREEGANTWVTVTAQRLPEHEARKLRERREDAIAFAASDAKHRITTGRTNRRKKGIRCIIRFWKST